MKRGRRPTRREPEERTGALDGHAFADMLDELPGDDFDLDVEVRRMAIASGSNAYAQRRRE